MKTCRYLYLLISVLILSCNPDKSRLSNRWVLLERKSSISAQDRRDMNKLMMRLPITIVDYTSDPLSGSFIQFTRSGKYLLRLSTVYSQGNWELENDSSILLQSSPSEKIVIRIKRMKKDTLRLYFEPGGSFGNYLNFLTNDKPVSFISDTVSYFFSSNPYSFEKNKWALKATRELTENEVREKLINYIEYLIAALNDKRDNSRYLEKIANPVRIAANGISLEPKRNVDPEWQNLFYNQEGFDLAYSLLQETFRCNISIKNTQDFVELDTDLLNQIRDILLNRKSCR